MHEESTKSGKKAMDWAVYVTRPSCLWLSSPADRQRAECNGK